MRCLLNFIYLFIFVFAASQFDWPSLKKIETMKLPKVEGCILKYFVPPLWHTYIGESRTTFAKAYGIKVRCYGEHVGEHWELGKDIGNLMGTHWEHIGNQEYFLKILPPKLRRKKSKSP
jgi:hypothetical protein